MSTKINLNNLNKSQNLNSLPMNSKKYLPTKNTLSNFYNPQDISILQCNSKENNEKQQIKIMPLPQLMTRLNRYRDLKQIPLHSFSDNNQKLWRDSPCSLQYVKRNISLDRTNKFTIGSIYHRDNINQQKKVFTQSEKPQLLLKNFKRMIQDAVKDKSKFNNKSIISSHNNNKKRSQTLFKNTVPLNNKYYQIPAKIQLKYDKNGTRSPFQGEYNINEIKQNVHKKKSNFTSSARIDLGLPLNFNPGPGKYFSDSQIINIKGCLTMRAKLSKKDLCNSQIKTQRNRLSQQIIS